MLSHFECLLHELLSCQNTALRIVRHCQVGHDVHGIWMIEHTLSVEKPSKTIDVGGVTP